MPKGTVSWKLEKSRINAETGEVKVTRRLQILRDQPRVMDEGEEGQFTFTFFPKFDLSEFRKGTRVMFEYERFFIDGKEIFKLTDIEILK